MYIVTGISLRKSEFNGTHYEFLTLHCLGKDKRTEGQTCNVFSFNLNSVSAEVCTLLRSIKVGDKIADIAYNKYGKPCGFLK